MSKYYKVTGKTRIGLIEIGNNRRAAIKKIQRIARKLGAKQDGFLVHSSSGISPDHIRGFVLNKKTKFNELQLRVNKENRRYHVPNMRFKEGKSLAKELDNIPIPGAHEAGKLLQVPHKQLGKPFSGTAGFHHDDKPRGIVVAEVRDDYEIPDALTKDMKRISDLDYEEFKGKLR